MPSANEHLSNGTCYFGKDNQTRGDFIPCGNIAFGDWPCCSLGDSCLGFETANACFDPDTGNAYMAGCTDRNYVDKTCPQKLGFGDQEWVGMIQCGTDPQSSDDTDWGGCKVTPENATDLFRLPNSNCDQYCGTTLWVGTSDIPTFAVLPTSSGGSVTWFSDFNPTSTYRPPGTAATSPTTPTQTLNVQSEGLSAGAKVGIGIGSAAAGLILLGLLAWLIFRHRRRANQRRAQPQQDQQQDNMPQDPQGPHYTTFNSGNMAAAPSPMTSAASPDSLDPLWRTAHSPKPFWTAGSEAFTGYKNELPADEIQPREIGSPPLEPTTPSSLAYSASVARGHSIGSRPPGSETLGPLNTDHEIYAASQINAAAERRFDPVRNLGRGRFVEMEG